MPTTIVVWILRPRASFSRVSSSPALRRRRRPWGAVHDRCRHIGQFGNHSETQGSAGDGVQALFGAGIKNS